jgi:hypothetical protein
LSRSPGRNIPSQSTSPAKTPAVEPQTEARRELRLNSDAVRDERVFLRNGTDEVVGGTGDTKPVQTSKNRVGHGED